MNLLLRARSPLNQGVEFYLRTGKEDYLKFLLIGNEWGVAL